MVGCVRQGHFQRLGKALILRLTSPAGAASWVALLMQLPALPTCAHTACRPALPQNHSMCCRHVAAGRRTQLATAGNIGRQPRAAVQRQHLRGCPHLGAGSTPTCTALHCPRPSLDVNQRQPCLFTCKAIQQRQHKTVHRLPSAHATSAGTQPAGAGGVGQGQVRSSKHMQCSNHVPKSYYSRSSAQLRRRAAA